MANFNVTTEALQQTYNTFLAEHQAFSDALTAYKTAVEGAESWQGQGKDAVLSVLAALEKTAAGYLEEANRGVQAGDNAIKVYSATDTETAGTLNNIAGQASETACKQVFSEGMM